MNQHDDLFLPAKDARYNKARFRKLISLLLVFMSLSAIAQQTNTCSITGKVCNSRNHKPIDYANVLLYKQGDSTIIAHTATEPDGSFVLQTAPGNYYMVISCMGYENQQTAVVHLTKDQQKIRIDTISLHPAHGQLAEVVVSGRKKQVTYQLDKRIIAADSYISSGGGTAKDVLEHTPSVRIDAEGNLTFRGSGGFKVLINGKPGLVDGSAALEQIPANQIENIEIMATPSARNSAEGTVGIINIITKKQTTEGWSGVINSMASSALSRGVDFILADKKNRTQWQLTGAATRTYRLSDFDQTKTINLSDTLTTTRSQGERKGYWENYSLKTGVDLYTTNTTYTAEIEGGYRGTNRGGSLHYDDIYAANNGSAPVYTSYNGSDVVDLHEWFAKASVGFDHRFKSPGRKLTGSLYLMYGGDALEYFQTDLYDPNGKQQQGHKAWEDEFRWTSEGRLDYVHPLNDKGGRFDAGYNFYSYTEDGDYTIKMYDPALEKFIQRDDLYCSYLFRRDIHSLYTMLANTHAQFSYQAGLRGELAHEVLSSSEKWAEHSYNKLDLFPSAHLSYAFNETSRTTLSYSRRIARAELYFMEPYVVYVDYYTAQKGNPDIRSEYINSIEWGYNRTFQKNTIAGALFYRARKDKIERIRTPYHTGVTLDSMANVGNDYSAGTEFSSNIQCTPWWSIDVNGSLFYYKIKNQYKVNGKDEKSWNWQLGISNSLNVSKSTRAQIEGYYVGPSVSTQGRVDDFYYINLSVRQLMLKKKLSAALSLRDAFSTARYVNTISAPDLTSYTHIKPRSPLLTVTLSYTFRSFNTKKTDGKAAHDLFEGTNR